MTKLRVILYGPFGSFKGYRAAAKVLEQWASANGIHAPSLTRIERLKFLHTEFVKAHPRNRCSLLIWREVRHANYMNSEYKTSLPNFGFRRKKKVHVVENAPFGAAFAQAQAHAAPEPGIPQAHGDDFIDDAAPAPQVGAAVFMNGELVGHVGMGGQVIFDANHEPH